MYKIECFPDMTENGPDGKCVLVMSYRITNKKRFKALTDEEMKILINNIERFQNRLNIFKEDLKSNKP